MVSMHYKCRTSLLPHETLEFSAAGTSLAKLSWAISLTPLLGSISAAMRS